MSPHCRDLLIFCLFGVLSVFAGMWLGEHRAEIPGKNFESAEAHEKPTIPHCDKPTWERIKDGCE